MTREPSDTPGFWDPESQMPPVEFLGFSEWLEKVDHNPELIIDAISSLDKKVIGDIFISCYTQSAVEQETADAMNLLLHKWYELAKQRGDEDVIKDPE